MISSNADLDFYLKADEIALNIPEKGARRLKARVVNRIWRFERLLRKAEYRTNTSKSRGGQLFASYARFRAYHLGTKLGYEIPVNVFGAGLSIAHQGLIIVNPNSRVGENCRIHNCVHIGTEAGYNDRCPVIGNNAFIGPGAQIFGAITLADGIAVGANSVVNKSFSESDISIAGVPAKKISDKGSSFIYHRPTEILRAKRSDGDQSKKDSP